MHELSLFMEGGREGRDFKTLLRSSDLSALDILSLSLSLSLSLFLQLPKNLYLLHFVMELIKVLKPVGL